MKIPQFLITFSASFLITFSSLTAQTTVATDPVGYVTIDVKGGGTNIISNAGLLQPISYRGIGDVANETVLSVSSANYTNDEFASTHYVQFTTSGDWAAITSNTSDTINLETSVANGSNLEFTIRPLNTLDSLFGSDNSAGFTGGSSFGISDKIFIWDADQQVFTGFYYYNNDFDEWRDISNNSDTVIVYPDESLVILAVNDFDLTLLGSVQENSTSGFVAGTGKTSVIPNPYSIDLKISQTGFESILNGGSSFGLADNVFVWNASTQTFTGFYYYNDIESEWQSISNQTVSNLDFIPVGGSAVVIKRSSGNAFWKMNQPF